MPFYIYFMLKFSHGNLFNFINLFKEVLEQSTTDILAFTSDKEGLSNEFYGKFISTTKRTQRLR